MITRSDALDIMTAVVAAHPRTAPRWHDDPDAARATADIWAKMFNRHNLAAPDILEAVIVRAADTPQTAPEPGELVAAARQIRQDRASREQGDRDQRALHEAKIDRKIANFAGNFGIEIDGPIR